METFDPTKAYLIHLSGQGDTDLKLVNHETFAWVCNGGEPPACQVEAHWEMNQPYEPNETREDVALALREMTGGSSPDNDRALHALSDSFEGKSFSGYEKSIRDVISFLKDIGMELGDEYEGCIY